jgi:hypothetical protein
MIKLTVRWMNRFAEIEFPCTDTELQQKLTEVRPTDTSPDEIFVQAVHQPTMLSMLEDQFLNMDEVNFLAKRMDSFTYDELLQFYAAAQYEQLQSPKDLINLTYNLPCYTVVHDLRNLEAIGKTHYMNINGAVSASEMKKIDFAAIGRELIRSGNGKPTECGLLFKNQDVPYEEIYDGVNFPEYYHTECLAAVSITHGRKTEHLYLPCDELSITKAMYRVGAANTDELTVRLDSLEVDAHEWSDRIKELLRDSSIYDVNEVLAAIDTADMNLDKLSAVMEYADADSPEAIIALAEHIDDFVFVPDVHDPIAVSGSTIASIKEYALHPHLEDFFDHQRFGEHLIKQYDGKFVSGGYVCMDEGAYLDEILADIPDQGMGGM